MERVISLFRPDKKVTYIVLSRHSEATSACP